MQKYFVTMALFILSPATLLSQRTQSFFEQVKNYTRSQVPNNRDSSRLQLDNVLDNSIHYLYPLYQAIGMETHFKKTLGEKGYYSNTAQFLSMLGDYSQALAFEQRSYDSINPHIINEIHDLVNDITDVQSMNAAGFITGSALSAQVVMINEAHDKPVHRAFTMSLLEELYNQGFRFLAMETFNNFSFHSLQQLNNKTGYYTNEPVAGEMVRKAIALGYTLVSYEDTLASLHNATQRDSAQAANLYAFIRQNSQVKMLVHAGYGHISETSVGDYFIPMAMAFKKISGIDPLTIDQTLFTEGSSNEYGRVLYNQLMKKISITEPVVLLKNRKPYSLVDRPGYDITVIHPPAVYQNNRPTWLSLDGHRKQVGIQPQEKKVFLLQAYYEDEYNNAATDQLVPADQTYIPSDYGYYDLYLFPGKYKLVFRDIGYKILSVKDKEVR